MEAPRQSHLQAAKRILRYVKGSQNAGILYRRENVNLSDFLDSDWAGGIEESRIRLAYL